MLYYSTLMPNTTTLYFGQTKPNKIYSLHNFSVNLQISTLHFGHVTRSNSFIFSVILIIISALATFPWISCFFSKFVLIVDYQIMFNPFDSSERSLIPNRQIFLEPAQQLSQARDLRLDGPSPKCLDIESCWKSIHHSPNFVKRHIEARKLETVWRKCFLQIILKFKNRRGPCTKSRMPNCKLSIGQIFYHQNITQVPPE